MPERTVERGPEGPMTYDELGARLNRILDRIEETLREVREIAGQATEITR